MKMRLGKVLTSIDPSKFAQPLLIATLLLLSLPAFSTAPPAENTLYTFSGGADGAWPKAGVIFGPDGALYGATQYGGNEVTCAPNGCGTIYKVVPNSDGTWTQTVIYSFADVNDGAGPIGSLAFDAAGNIYGTTAFGQPYGQGTVFKISSNSAGSWSATVLYAFTGGSDGGQPLTGVIFDKSGNLYGTTSAGGQGGGVAYKLSPNSDGSWTQTVIHTFGSISPDGYIPSTGLLLDAAGNLFGATAGGGANTAGSVYELSPNSSGTWTGNILYSFTGKADGALPNALVFDKSGNLYGAAFDGGTKGTVCDNGCGTIFRLARSSAGAWPYTRVFAFNDANGWGPNGLVFDSAGNLYGTTVDGGTDIGVAYQLKRNSTGQRWTYTLLSNFGPATGGIEPFLTTIKSGKIYGTTISTTSCYLCGTVFQITP